MTDPDTSQRVALLGGVPLLSRLTGGQLKTIAETSHDRAFRAGEMILREGEMGSGLYLILLGTAEVRRSGQAVAWLAPGDFFGEAALLVDQPRTADVLATTDVRCLTLSRWDFWSAVGIDPQVNQALFEETVRRLRAFRGELVE